MGIKAKLAHEASVISRRVGGSIRNQAQRYKLLSPFFDFLQVERKLPKRVKDIDLNMLRPFVEKCLAEDIGIGHLHNTLAAIRVILRHAGVDVTNVSNKDLGVPPRSRVGKKRPYTAAELKMLWPRARRKDMGFYHVVRLQRLLGLRSQEALMCGPSLAGWREVLQNYGDGGESLLPITRGAKNGRYREVAILTKRVQETIDAIEEAYAYCARNEFRLLGTFDNLKKARMRLMNLYKRAGISGECSSHALRYTYACEKALELLSKTEPREALKLLSNYLGHGDSRYRWIKSVYCRSIADKFETSRRKARSPTIGTSHRAEY